LFGAETEEDEFIVEQVADEVPLVAFHGVEACNLEVFEDVSRDDLDVALAVCVFDEDRFVAAPGDQAVKDGH